jgi:hypothetical protein
MSTCAACGKRHLWRRLGRRLAIPEYRMLTGFWPWIDVRVCDGCLENYDREFAERLHLLAPDVLENNEPVVERVCLVCGTLESPGEWREAWRWVTAEGRPARHARFFLCSRHADFPYVDGIIVSSNLTSLDRMKAVLNELPTVGSDLLARVEHWRPEEGKGPPEAAGFAAGLTRDQAAEAALHYWRQPAEEVDAKAAWMGPIRKNYRMRYRLDLVRDYAGGRREVLTVVRTALDRFTTYRTTPHAAHPKP